MHGNALKAALPPFAQGKSVWAVRGVPSAAGRARMCAGYDHLRKTLRIIEGAYYG